MSNYPQKVDTDFEVPGVYDNVSEISGTSLNSLRDAVFAIERSLGINLGGSQQDLVSRINRSLNQDGTIRQDALASAGLISLPVTDSEVGASAAIQESKLDLDVPTTSLQNQITSNNQDIAQLQQAYTKFLIRYQQHVTGVGDRHSSDQIDHQLADGYLAGGGSTVRSAIDYLNGELDFHKSNTQPVEHYASAISYLPRTVDEGETAVITANNVQDAVTQVETSFVEDRRKHNDEAHTDGVSNDGYIYLNGQAGVNDASLSLTRLIPASGRGIVKVGLCNSAVIKSKGFSPTAISATAHSIVFVAKVSGQARTLQVDNINTLSYPAGVARVSLDGVVNYLNGQFANSSSQTHFPLTAYSTEDGEIAIQHNIAHDDCTIQVTVPGSNSAVSALGFSAIAGTEVRRNQNFVFTIDGNRFTELKVLSTGSGNHTNVSTASINLGVDVSASGLNILSNSLIHIYDHAVPAANGTYQVQSVSSITVVDLVEPMSHGTFSYVIYADSFSTDAFTDIGDSLCLGMFLDQSRNPVSSIRATTTPPISGVSIVEVSEDFPATTGIILSVTVSGTRRSVRLEHPTASFGAASSFENGFSGYLKIQAPDGISYLTLFVNGATVSAGSATVVVSASARQDNLLRLGCGSFLVGSSTLELPLVRRPIGLVGQTSISNVFRKQVLERDIGNLNANGVVRGFDLLSFVGGSTNTISLSGGSGYIDGRYIEEGSATIRIPIGGAGTSNLTLSKDGIFEVFEENAGTVGGLLASDIAKSSDKILLRQIVTGPSSILSVRDSRFFINQTQSKLQLTIDSNDFGTGVFKSLEAATDFVSNNFTGGRELTALSDLISTNDISVSNNTILNCFGGLATSANLSIDGGSMVRVSGDLVASGTDQIQISNRSSLILDGYGLISIPIVLSGGSSLVINDVCYIDSQITLGEGCRISGRDGYSAIIFGGGQAGVVVDDADGRVDDLKLIMSAANGLFPIVSLSGASEGFRIEGCSLSQTGDVVEANWNNFSSDFNRAGILKTDTSVVSGVSIESCKFENFSAACYLTYTDGLEVSNNIFSNVAKGIYTGNATNSKIIRNTLSLFRDGGILTPTSIGGLVQGCSFSQAYNDSSPPVCVVNGSQQLQLSANTFYNMTVANAVVATAPIRITGNGFYEVSSTGYLVDADGLSAQITFDENTVALHQGQVLRSPAVSMRNNNVEVLGVFSNSRIFDISGQTSSNLLNLSMTGANQTEIYLQSGLFSENKVSCGQINSLVGQSVQMSGNDILVAFAPVIFGNNLTGVLQVDDNFITSGGSFEALRLSDTVSSTATVSVIGNKLSTASGASSLVLGTVGIDSTATWLVKSNHIVAGGNTGIRVFADNVSVIGNMIKSATTHDIVVEASADNVYVSDNHLSAGSITTAVPNQSNVFIGQNKNLVANLSFSSMSGIQDADASASAQWKIVANKMTASGQGAIIYIPLSLPVGGQIVSFQIRAVKAATNPIQATLYTTASNGTVSVVASGSITVSSLFVVNVASVIIQNNQEYFLKITSGNNLDTISQCLVAVRY